MASLLILASCATKQEKDDFDYTVESFADLEILRYKVPGFEELSLKQKEFITSPKLRHTAGIYFMTKTENGTWPFAALSKQSIKTIPETAKVRISKILKFI